MNCLMTKHSPITVQAVFIENNIDANDIANRALITNKQVLFKPNFRSTIESNSGIRDSFLRSSAAITHYGGRRCEKFFLFYLGCLQNDSLLMFLALFFFGKKRDTPFRIEIRLFTGELYKKVGQKKLELIIRFRCCFFGISELE